MKDNTIRMTRLNPVLDLLEADKPVFTMWVNYYGVGSDYQTAAAVAANPDYDFLLYDLEHQPYDLERLRRFLWDLLDPGQIESQGRRVTKPVIARIPASGREMNDWVIKQVLDTGVAGIMLPHIETPEQALHAVAAARYPAAPYAANPELRGRRGFSPAVPVRYWGVSHDQYITSSDVWGLDPNGNLLLIFIIENQMGVDNVREIASALHEANVKCILWAGGGDMTISYGEGLLGGPATEASIETILAAGREFDIPIGLNSFDNVETQYARGARAFFTLGPSALATSPLSVEARKAIGR